MCKHEYYLSRGKAFEKDKTLSKYKFEIDAEPSSKKKSKKPTPVSSDHYKLYESVLPTVKTINNFKHVLAIQHEKDAALALHNVKNWVKSKLHFDSTHRSKIDNDWPWLI